MTTATSRADAGAARLRRVRDAVASVSDPEYPGVSIADLGLVESIDLDEADDVAVVGLIPTFTGCPALAMIAGDVRTAVEALGEIRRCDVRWLSRPVWTTDRITRAGRRVLADEYTVVLRDDDGGLRCPVCGGGDVVPRSDAGSTRCRAVAWCAGCRNPVEVMR